MSKTTFDHITETALALTLMVAVPTFAFKFLDLTMNSDALDVPLASQPAEPPAASAPLSLYCLTKSGITVKGTDRDDKVDVEIGDHVPMRNGAPDFSGAPGGVSVVSFPKAMIETESARARAVDICAALNEAGIESTAEITGIPANERLVIAGPQPDVRPCENQVAVGLYSSFGPNATACAPASEDGISTSEIKSAARKLSARLGHSPKPRVTETFRFVMGNGAPSAPSV